jgi:hypothetical protein
MGWFGSISMKVHLVKSVYDAAAMPVNSSIELKNSICRVGRINISTLFDGGFHPCARKALMALVFWVSHYRNMIETEVVWKIVV